MINQVNNGTKATNVYDKLKINKPQKTEKKGLYAAMDIGKIWLERALKA